MSQLSLDSSLQTSRASKLHYDPRHDTMLQENLSEKRSNTHENARNQPDCQVSSVDSNARRSIPLVPSGQHSTLTSASHTVLATPKSTVRHGRNALQRAKQQVMQTPFKPTTTVNRQETFSGISLQKSVGGTSSFSGSLFHNNQPLGQRSLSNTARKPSSASLGTRSVVTLEPEQFAATKASLKIEFQRFVDEKEAFLKQKEQEMLEVLTGRARDLAKSLATTSEQCKSDIIAKAKENYSDPSLQTEYLKLHQSSMKEAQKMIRMSADRVRKEAIEKIQGEHSTIFRSLEMEKNHLLAVGKDIIAQVRQAKDMALTSITNFQAGALRSLNGYLKCSATGSKVAQMAQGDFALNFMTPRKKRSPTSKRLPSKKVQYQEFQSCSTSLGSATENSMCQDPMKKKRHVNVSKSKNHRKNSSAFETADASDGMTACSLSEPQCSPFKFVSPSSTDVKKVVPVVSSRKQKRPSRHSHGRSKRARLNTSGMHNLDFKDDVSFSFRGM
ncbi:hypothetical protein FisN_25Lh221 [Fistulifera solaris]|uniref:Uncharacterized protein n=1 Tax=Fistulifera solaris TaxID=1519565 RepID=A0A1Z5KRB1_FISSO|nr:hypothetical protein FisN_25Lh221 [Fistulifera solaris]|eukprot:GAX28727.1 hypothetical protein FisN_25Lh221 [Fistulifera solaris]